MVEPIQRAACVPNAVVQTSCAKRLSSLGEALPRARGRDNREAFTMVQTRKGCCMGVRKRLLKKELRKSKSADDQLLYEDRANLHRIRYKRIQGNKKMTKLYDEYKKSPAQFSMTFSEYAQRTEADRRFLRNVRN